MKLVDERGYHAGLKGLRPKMGEEFEMRVERLKAARTSKQNSAYWGYIVRPVALACHTPSIDVHRIFKAELLPAEKFTLANPDTGEVRLERDLEMHTTTLLSEEEFEHYMEHARALAMERIGIDMSEKGLFEQFGILRG
jgi:hypothetical protein